MPHTSDTTAEKPVSNRDERVARNHFGVINHVTLISGLLALSVGLNVLLARKVSALKDYAEILRSESRLRVGTKVPAITGQSPGGAKRTLNYDEVNVPTVLYVFTPQCPWCKANIANLHALIENSGLRYRVIGVSLSSVDLKEYLSKEKLALPVFSDVDNSIKAAYRFGGTPTTIVVSPMANVLKVWTGAYQGDVRQEIEGYLNVRLPGCCDAAKSQ